MDPVAILQNWGEFGRNFSGDDEPNEDIEGMDEASDINPDDVEDDLEDQVWDSDGAQEEEEDYFAILKHLSKKWLETEVNHKVSKTASEAFWSLGREWFHKLFVTKSIQNVKRKTPSFVHIRRRLYKEYVPPVMLQFGFKNKVTNEIVNVDNSLVTPKSAFPPHQFDKLWEIAHVQVNFFFVLIFTYFLFTYANNCFETVRPSQKKV